MMIDNLAAVVKQAWETSPNGGIHKFIDLGDGTGLKVLKYGSDEEDAPYRRERLEKSFKLQREAAKHNLGPEVGELVEFNMGDQTYFGYTTEVIEAFPFGDSYEGGLSDNEEYQEWEDRHYAELPDTLEELKKHLGISVWDSKALNFGFRDGVHMLIDFGDEGYTELKNFVLKNE